MLLFDMLAFSACRTTDRSGSLTRCSYSRIINPTPSTSSGCAIAQHPEQWDWFDKGNQLNIPVNISDEAKIKALNKIPGLAKLVHSLYHSANKREEGLLMEFVLHGLASYSLLSKKVIDGKVEFKDLMGSILNFDTNTFGDEELE